MFMRRLFLVPVLVGALSAFSAPARAEAGVVTGTGTGQTTIVTFTVIKQASGNTFFMATTATVETGIETGSCTGAFTGVSHADGSTNATASQTCTGTIAGHPGTWQLQPVAVTIAPDGTIDAHEVVTGLGSLAGLHGTRTVTGGAGGNPEIFTDRLFFDD